MPPRTARPPHPLAEPLHRGALHLLRALRAEDAAAPLSAARLSALSVLVFAGPRTLTALAAAEQVSAPTMSHLVDGLARAGWVRRVADPADARSAQIEATRRGVALLHSARARRLRALSRALGTLAPADQQRLARALPALLQLATLTAERAAPPGDPPARRIARRRPD